MAIEYDYVAKTFSEAEDPNLIKDLQKVYLKGIHANRTGKKITKSEIDGYIKGLGNGPRSNFWIKSMTKAYTDGQNFVG